MPKSVSTPAFLGIFGHINVDWIVDARRRPPVELGPFYGGVAGNIAVGASRFGVPVRIGSVVGRNFPSGYFRLLKQLGVDMRFLRKDRKADTSSCRMTNMPDGSQKKEIFHGPHNEHVRMPPEFVKGLKHLHVSTGLPQACIDVLKLGHKQGCKVAFDPGADLARHYEKEHLLEALSYSDIFMANDEEFKVAMRIIGVRERKGVLRHVGTILITSAERGSLLITRRSITKIPGFEVPKVADPTGAGDAYRSGIYAGLYRNYPLKISCILGALAASACIQRRGAQGGLESWDELEQMFWKFKG